MDMNDVIIFCGGVERIDAPLPITATDAEIATHLANECHGSNVPTLAQVKAATPVYQDVVAKAASNQVILDQISELENSATPDRYIDASLGLDGGWLLNLRNQIAALRATLVP